MNKLFLKYNYSLYLTYLISLLLIILGVTVIFGWFTHELTLIQVNESFVPMVFNTAIGFLISGMGLLFILMNKKNWSILFAAILIILGVLTLVQYIYPINLGIDEVFIDNYITRGAAYKGQMAPNTAFCFLLTGIVYIVYSLGLFKNHINKLLIPLGLLIFIIGLISTASYSLGLASSFDWSKCNEMAIHTSIGFMLLGFGILSWLWFNKINKYLFSSSIQSRLIISIIIPVVLIFISASYFNMMNLKNITVAKTDAELSMLNYQSANIIDQELFKVEGVLNELKMRLINENDIDEKILYEILEENVRSNNLIYGSAIAFGQYKYKENRRLFAPYVYKTDTGLCHKNVADAYDYAEKEWFTKPQADRKSVWTEPFYDDGAGDALMCTYCVPIFKDKELWAVITVDVLLRDLAKEIGLIVSNDFDYYIVSTSGYYIYNSYDKDQTGKHFHSTYYKKNYTSENIEDLYSVFTNNLTGKFNSTNVYYNSNYWYYYVPIANAPWKVYLGIPESKAFEGLISELINRFIMMLLMIMLLMVIIYFISRKLTVPILQLSKAAEKIALGSPEDIIDIKTNDEIGQLAHAFNLMSLNLKEREQSLAQSDEKFSSFVEQTSEGVYFLKMRKPIPVSMPVEEQIKHIYEGFIVEANDSQAKMSGYLKADDIKGITLAEFRRGKNELEDIKILKSWIKSGYRITGRESSDLDKNGNKVWFSNNVIGYVENSYLLHLWGSQTDITERKKLENTKDILVNISNAVLTTDNFESFSQFIFKEFKKIIDTSNFFIALYDEETQLISSPFIADKLDEEIISFPAEKTLTGYVIQTKKSLLINEDEFSKHIKEGHFELVGPLCQVWIGVPLLIKGKVIGAIVIQNYEGEKMLDNEDLKVLEYIAPQISLAIERKTTLEDLKIALEKAQESDRLKTAFLASMSHEIRTPLNAIVGFSTLIAEESEDLKLLDLSDTIHNQNDLLLQLIDDLIDFSKVEAGILDFDNKLFDINKIIIELSLIFNTKCHKDVELIAKSSFDSFIVSSDELRVRQIFSNLISNAIKFTRKGNISFGYEVVDNSEIRCFVRDTGIGVPIDKQNEIFERFTKLDAFSQGTGLGLSIVKNIVELMNGEIWLESEPGKGSCFYFKIPSLIQKQGELKVKDKPSMIEKNIKKTDITILIAEDNESSSFLLERILEAYNMNILRAKNGQDAVELCKSRSDIDMVLMDIKMPILDGYDATRQIKQIRPHLPIIAQTAYAMEVDKNDAKESGCDDYISKPIIKEKLISLLKKYIPEIGL
ncbi:ATP-binding protein [Ancylomarina sp. 16SWW S1-10-2]|uniref:PDC sensor domain-containing protein n=1 Tax=Ancylomarina sp. 16SWW S1-10-2 TaxID=2499681 RepID=UPI0012ADDF1E|nr:ATP-binding protein [Ancylomarina sp. 16SWW S1-10-2]MRT91877.1 response regulator [Ancylomarina sp. 16SWW S1-10-2]